VQLVYENNYTESFGYQWNKFNKTQLDNSLKNCQLSKERFFTQTGWDKEDLAGKDVLEVGSGAGRFTQVVLDYTKANLYSIDYSNAVFANYQNNKHHGNRLKLFQASIYEMPFPDNSFDKVFCFGVLQHTPDFKKSVKCLIDKVKPGGEVVVDFYPIRGWWTKLQAKYLLRPFTKKMDHDKLLHIIDANADRLISTFKFFEKIGLGQIFNRFLPVCDIKASIPAGLSKQELREWVVLDTFDMFSPEHDHPQKLSTVAEWFKEFGMDVTFAGDIKVGMYYRVTMIKGIKK
jgi:SAM-dependent methyltransferase